MWAPDGITKKKRECWEVLSSIYGKRSAGYDWKQMFVPAILKFGFKATTIDETVFVKRNDKNPSEFIMIAVYVDDTLAAETWEEEMTRFKFFLADEFDTNDQGHSALQSLSFRCGQSPAAC